MLVGMSTAGGPSPAAPHRPPPIGFAHRGARAHARENTIEAFRLAVRLGATGLESDVWATADGVAVLDHDGVVGWLRRRIAGFAHHRLPDHIPTLAELYEVCGTELELSLDVKDPDVVPEVLRVARDAGAVDRLWLCHDDRALLSRVRDGDPDVHLVHSTRWRRVHEAEERWAADLEARSIEAVNLHHADWTAGRVTLFHRFGRRCWAWDAQHARVLDKVLGYGVDAVFSDHVDRMVDALAAAHPGAGR